MRFDFISPARLLEEMPATLHMLQELDRSLMHNGFEIRIADPDTHEHEIEIYVDPPDKEIENSIKYILTGHCCRCGSNDDVKTVWFDKASSYKACNTFCQRCRRLLETSKELNFDTTKYLQHILSFKKHHKDLPVVFSRLRIDDGKNIRDVDTEEITVSSKNEFAIEIKSGILNFKRLHTIDIIGIETELTDYDSRVPIFTGDYVNIITYDGKEIKGIVEASFVCPGLPNTIIITLTEHGKLPGLETGRIASSCCFIQDSTTKRRFPLVLAQKLSILKRENCRLS